MTVDTAVKIEGEKCVLDVVSSCEDLPPPTSVGDGGREYNGDGKDDYVFVNGSDADDHGEVEGNGELNVSESNAALDGKMEGVALKVIGGDQFEVFNGYRDNVVKVNGGESKLENGLVVEEESDGKVECGELVKENGEIQVESGSTVENGEAIVERGDSKDTEGEVDVKVRDLEVFEKSDAKSAVDEVKDGESGIENRDVSNTSVDGSGFPSLDNDNRASILLGIDSGSEKVQNGTTIVEAEPQMPHGKIEEVQLHLGRSEELENKAREPEKLEDGIRKPEVIEVNANSNIREVLATHSDPVDGIIKESETNLLGEDVEHEPQEDSVVETRPLDGDVKAPDSEAEKLLLDDAIIEKQSPDCQPQDLQQGDSRELGPAEVEAEVRGLGDSDSPGISGSQDLISLDSEAAVCEPQQQRDQDASDVAKQSEELQDSQNVPEQSEGGENLSNFELTAPEVDVPVLKSSVRTDETSTVAMQSEKSDKPVVDQDHELDKVHGEGKAELNGLESSVREVSLEDQVTEGTGLVDDTEREVSSEDVSVKKPSTVEEEINLSILNSANEAAVDEGKDLDASHLADGVSDNEVNVPDSPHDSGSCLRSGDGDSTVDLPVLCNSDNKAIDDGSCAGDDCSTYFADKTSAQPKLSDNNDAIPDPVNGPEFEVKPVNSEIDLASKINHDFRDTEKSKISFGSFECIAPFSHNDDINIHTDILNRSIKLSTSQSNVSGGNFKSNVGTANGVCSLNFEATKVQFSELIHDKPCAEVVSSEESNMDEVSASPRQGSGADSSDGQNVNPDLVRRPFYYLIRLPRFEDAKLTEQIKLKEVAVEEKTRNRDAVRIEFQKRKASYWEHKTNFEAARSEERAAHKLLMAKKREIDSAQSLINLAKNAITVEDVDSRIINMERRIQHETMKLDEEKRLVHEIKQLNYLREQLSANTRKQQELQQAKDQRVETEEHLKVLRKEMDALRENHAKAEELFKAAKKKYDEESALLNDLRDQFKSADSIRQEAYALLQGLKKQAFEKNKLFYNYKDDAKVANDYAAAGQKDSLEWHCINQVEKFMELWNNNDEFRKEYLRCNTKSTLRRFNTLDGRSLGPDEEPPSLGNASDTKVNASSKVSSVGIASNLERDFPLVAKNAEAEPSKKVIEQKNKIALVKKRVETTAKNSLAEPSGRVEIEENEEEHKLTKEEEELAWKAEQKRKEEEVARLKEQRRLEEIAKAQEAQERKRRIAEKAQARAEFRARKEAEEKEKEREKRAKKKGKKKGPASEISEVEPAQLPESASETIREPEVTEKPVVKKSHKPALYTKQVKTTKSISAPPAPLRNRSRRRIPQWVWWLVLAILTVILIFLLGSIDIVGKVKRLFSGSSQ